MRNGKYNGKCAWIEIRAICVRAVWKIVDREKYSK